MLSEMDRGQKLSIIVEFKCSSLCRTVDCLLTVYNLFFNLQKDFLLN